jgi:GTP-binding protein
VRFVERKLREEFDFAGTPIHVSVRPRKKQGRDGARR